MSNDPEQQPGNAQHLLRHKRLLIALAVVGVIIGYLITYWLPTEGWPQWRRIGAGAVMGLWCAYIVVLTRAGGAFK